MQLIREWHHLTWGGRVSIAWYPLRRLLITPAPQDRRCYMGAPCGEDLHCPREAIDESLWCRRHQKWSR